jgi:hypothetical protein
MQVRTSGLVRCGGRPIRVPHRHLTVVQSRRGKADDLTWIVE